ncbi:acetyl-CoA C-acyltransferase [Paenibacillus sp. MER TA 81-3]|uniref:acetyl-CoA C-acyltransferase n=1 Tax=Paenibacillus sp. MER TA 81-3 TaxID=2939573 RepID=UPI00203E2E49|nr:acetyl-CoA C-acyltransferase [Paenibacillus sp. MER TA 81-3]MCM3337405.1 acetyl-CoA C-acyltransferase [Paenibacillus sp. MER TA 81-3]
MEASASSRSGREAVIVAAVRTPVGKGKRGALAETRAEDLGRAVIRAVLERAPALQMAEVEDVILGCAMPEGEQGLNVARVIALHAGLPYSVPGVTINRFCSSGLQAIAFAAERIMAGAADVIIAGGVESMSHVPMTGFKLAPHPEIADTMPELYMSMGHTAERVAQAYGISREMQDAFALQSHERAAAAQAAGAFDAELVPVQAARTRAEANGRLRTVTEPFAHDECVRPDTSLEALGMLKPSFSMGGTVTAGNSSPFSDGAAALLLMSRERAEALGLEPLAVYRTFAVAGVPPEVMGIGPTEAIPKALRQAGLQADDVALYELNEAFAAQCLAVIQQLRLNPERVNVNGGAIALGHPLGCTGAKLTTSLLYELRRRGGGYGVVSMCIGGGMGAAGVFEVLAPASV